MDIEQTPEIKKDGKETVGEHNYCQRCQHHNHLSKFVLIIIAVFVLVGCVAMVGRSLSFRQGSEGFVQVERPQFSSMMTSRNRGGGGMMGRRGISVAGKITKIDGNNLTVNDGSKDTTVTVADNTSIIKQDKIFALSDLKVDDQIIANGSSNSSGNYTATIIRVK